MGAPRCPSCNMFCGMEASEPEFESYEAQSDGMVSVEVRSVFTSACCGDEVREYRSSIESVFGEIEEHCHDHEEDGDDCTLFVDEPTDYEQGDRYSDVDRRGKPIRSQRYRKHYYSIEFSTRVSCDCGWSTDITMADEWPASGMDDLY